MRELNEIIQLVRSGERITTTDAIRLWREAPLWLLGELATERKRKVSGESVFFNRNIHIEPTNICLFNCEFCSFRRGESAPDAWYMSVEQVVERAASMKDSGITEIHIVGGVHPRHDLDTYCAMIRGIKRVLPKVAVKAYTAVEILYMIRRAEVSVVEGLRRLQEAGMECIPGGGAEIFDEELRAKICPDKCTSAEWLAVHRAAHNMDIKTNCTMLYGHIETIEQRVDHLNRLRDLQDENPGFDAFIPLKYRSLNNRMSEIGECSVEEDLRTIAMSRIFLDNIPHIKAYWVAYGKATTEMALAFGADDIDGTIDNSTKIYSMAGADARPSMSIGELCSIVHDAGFIPVERDTHYNVVRSFEDFTPEMYTPEVEQEVEQESSTELSAEGEDESAADIVDKTEEKSPAPQDGEIAEEHPVADVQPQPIEDANHEPIESESHNDGDIETAATEGDTTERNKEQVPTQEMEQTEEREEVQSVEERVDESQVKENKVVDVRVEEKRVEEERDEEERTEQNSGETMLKIEDSKVEKPTSQSGTKGTANSAAKGDNPDKGGTKSASGSKSGASAPAKGASGSKGGDKPNAGKSKGRKSKDAKEPLWSRLKRFYDRFYILCHIIFIGIFLVVLLLSLYFGLYIGTGHNERVALPNFVGMNIGKAKGVASHRGVQIVVRDTIFDPYAAPGEVLEQLPRPSDVRTVTVKPGRRIYVTINSVTSRMVDMIDVSSSPLRIAINKLEGANLTVEKLVYEPSDRSTDYVVRQRYGDLEVNRDNIDGWAQVPYNAGVTLYVTYERDKQLTEEPLVVGQSLQNARTLLYSRGLNVGDVHYDNSVTSNVLRREAVVYDQRLMPSIPMTTNRGDEVDLWLTCNKAMADSMVTVVNQRRVIEAQEREAALNIITIDSLMPILEMPVVEGEVNPDSASYIPEQEGVADPETYNEEDFF